MTKREIVIMEDIGTSGQPGGRGSWIGRTVDAYGTAFARHAFHLSDVRFLGTKVSRSWYVPLARLRRRLDRRQEGEPIGPLMKLAIGAPLGVTRYLDRLVPDDTGLAKMVFHPRD